jgi:cytochrome c-type biogenesis protein CcsB
MMLSGYLLKVVPLEGDPNNTWVSVYPHGDQRSVVADRLFPTYKAAIMEGLADGDFSKATSIVVELKKYQNAQNPDLLPSESQRTLEIWLNELKIFNRLALVYSLLGMAFLTTLFLQIFKPTKGFIRLHSILLLLMIVAFLFHTMGLGFRWYVSGRAPWSNGYESMIYIAWTATLAGLLFSRKASGALAATNVLSGVVLLIAMLSYLNPEITPLVPVLRSYWLTIHVSLEAGSYGFLMLGALIGVIDLVLMIFLTKENQSRIKDVVREMTKLSEMTLIGGLFMLSVGTYLGGVWANESWGRYWGWDAKETWALVSILVYAFILHMRFVPKLAGLYTFNFATLFGLASIIMTYYGVNYYLSGLHSYAAGDPVPVPAWVYWSIASLLLISGLAYWRQQKVWGSKS